MLFPNKTKYKKSRKGKYPTGIALNGNIIQFGTFAIKAIEPGIITSNQLESARKAIVRKTKRLGKLWIRIFPNIPVTKKPIEIRMGKGKGAVDHWICKLNSGKIIFELGDITQIQAQEAFDYAKAKLSVKTSLILNKFI